MMQLFTVNYWFGFPAFISSPFLTALLVIFGISLVAGLAIMGNEQKIQNRLYRQVALRSSYTATWIGAVGLVLTFMRVERAPLFMYRFWFLFLITVLVLQVWRIRKYALRRKVQLDEETRRYETYGKYIPHGKK